MVYTNDTEGGIHPLHIIKTVKASVRALGLEKQSIMENMVDTHYLCARGTMETNMSGKSDKLIMHFGRWYSLTLMQRIHEKYLTSVKDDLLIRATRSPFATLGQLNANPLIFSFYCSLSLPL